MPVLFLKDIQIYHKELSCHFEVSFECFMKTDRERANAVEIDFGKIGHLRSLAVTCSRRSLAVTSAVTCGHLGGHLRSLTLGGHCGGHLRSLGSSGHLGGHLRSLGRSLAVTCSRWSLRRSLAVTSAGTTCGQSPVTVYTGWCSMWEKVWAFCRSENS